MCKDKIQISLLERNNKNMKIRKHILPRRLVDVLCFLLIGVFMPIVFIFEMIVVLPSFHEPGEFFHTFTFILAIFLVFNIKGNMIACMMIDTSVDFGSIKLPLQLSDDLQNETKTNNGWRWCKHCERTAPPRSWHCKVCHVCILKRDHHCLFTGCCIGHRNHRYFMMFVLFLFIGATYAFVYNSLYLWVIHARVYGNWLSLVKMICPFLMLVTGSNWHNFYLVLYNLNILALFYSVLLLGYHCPTIFRGGVCYERSKGYPYDAGFMRNMQTIFGKRFHLVWLCPFISSELPDDGVTWLKNDINFKEK